MGNQEIVRYSSIENSYQQGFIERSPQEEYWWCITEKIHGSNFQVFCDGKTIKLGSRNRFLQSDENFNNLHNIIEELKERVLNLCEQLDEFPITLYGEVYGDGIQKGVKYSKEKKVKFFDIKVGEDYIPYMDAAFLLYTFNLPFVPVLETKLATLASVIETTDIRFNSTIAEGEYKNLEDNICEGVVIKPYTQELKTVMESRVIVKKKNEEFFEKKQIPKARQDKFVDYKEDVINLTPYINENRFNAVFSKDIYQKQNFAEFLKAYAEDVIEDANKDGVEFKNIKNLTNYIAKQSKILYFGKVA